MKLPGNVKRIAQVVFWEVSALAAQFGKSRLGFLTLTFPVTVTSIETAQKWWHSLATNVLRHRYMRIVATWERHTRGGIHWHAIVVLRWAMPEAFDFTALRASEAEYKRAGKSRLWLALVAQYRASANEELRAEWQFLRDTLPGYHFGRHQLEPVRGSVAAMARYAAKYIVKQHAGRVSKDAGARRVRFLGFSDHYVNREGERIKFSWRRACCKFGWATIGGRIWRAKCQSFAAANGWTEAELFAQRLRPASQFRSCKGRGRRGGSWAYMWLGVILSQDVRALLGKPGDVKALLCHAEEIKQRDAKRLLGLQLSDVYHERAQWGAAVATAHFSWERASNCILIGSPWPKFTGAWLVLGSETWLTREDYFNDYCK